MSVTLGIDCLYNLFDSVDLKLSIFFCVHCLCCPISPTLSSYYSDIIFATGAYINNLCMSASTHTPLCTCTSIQLYGKMSHLGKPLLVFLSIPCEQLTVEQQPKVITTIFHKLLIRFWWYFGNKELKIHNSEHSSFTLVESAKPWHTSVTWGIKVFFCGNFIFLKP